MKLNPAPKLGLRLLGAFSLLCALAAGPAAFAQQAAQPPGPTTAGASQAAPSGPSGAGEEVLRLDAYVVTAVSAPGETKMDSSVSISSYTQADLDVSVPRSTGELFRNMPGIRVESSSGDGNLNLTSRGLPINTGGSKYVQLQEDGLPVLQFGDISFATADQWLRADYGVASVESVIGGAASTAATNAPGGVINFISGTGGANPSGAIGIAEGLDYGQTRVDLGLSGPLGNDLTYSMSGFYRYGQGPKTAEYTAENGGQFRFNVTKSFQNGFVRVYFKELDDKVLSPLPIPMSISGSNSDPAYGSLPNFDARNGTLATPYLSTVTAVTTQGNTSTTSLSDGIHTTSTAIGFEVNLTPEGWTIDDKFRTAINGGDFVDPYPASVDRAQTIADTIAGGAGATLKYANGPAAGQSINPATLNGNGLLADVHMFNTQLNNFDNTFNDFKISRLVELGDSGRLNATAGVYSSSQNSDQTWTWNSYIEEVKGKNAALVNVYNAAGAPVTYNGVAAFGTSELGGWGNTDNTYDVTYADEAPYGALSYKLKGLTIEGSVREDYGKASGGTSGGLGIPEASVAGVALPSAVAGTVNELNPNLSPVDFSWHFTSYSVGGNYEFNKTVAVYARYSQGSSAGTMERIAALVGSTGSLVPGATPEATARQTEAGVKLQTAKGIPGKLELFATVFQAKVSEVNYDFTLASKGENPNYSADTKATGFDVDVGYTLGGFVLRGAATYTHSRIVGDIDNPAQVGNTPQRVPDWLFQLTPSYAIGQFSFGGAVIGVTKSFSDNGGQSGGPMQPGYVYENAFLTYQPTRQLSFTVGVNNLFDTIGITEVDSGRTAGGTEINARSIGGRTTSVSAKYTF